MLLGLDTSLLVTHAHASVGGRLALFAHNWQCLTRDTWVLETVKGYHLPLNQYPQHIIQTRPAANRSTADSLIKKEAVVPVYRNLVHLTSLFFVVPKSKGGWHPIMNLRKLNQCINTALQDT